MILGICKYYKEDDSWHLGLWLSSHCQTIYQEDVLTTNWWRWTTKSKHWESRASGEGSEEDGGGLGTRESLKSVKTYVLFLRRGVRFKQKQNHENKKYKLYPLNLVN